MNKITPCLWFDANAEEAVDFYTALFPNSRILGITRYAQSDHEQHRQRAGSVMTIALELNGQTYTALNGGPVFRFNEAVSFQVYCDTQKEIDRYWDKLSAGGDARGQQCGWLTDRFGLSWQIVPTVIVSLLQHDDAARAARVMNALLKMRKIDIAALEAAAAGHPLSPTATFTQTRNPKP